MSEEQATPLPPSEVGDCLQAVECQCCRERRYAAIIERAISGPPTPPPPKRQVRKLPRLSPQTVERYLAAVTREIAEGTIEPGPARGLLYAAQLMVSAVKAGAVKP